MDDRDKMISQKKNKNRQTITWSALAAALLLVGDLYVMINMPENYPVLGIVTVILLACTYILVHAVLSELDHSRQQTREQHEEVVKAEKASYLMTKKVLEQFGGIENMVRTPINDILTAQKGVAKITINRSREHAEAMMNANDKLMEQIMQFQEQMESVQNEFYEKNQTALKGVVQEISENGQRMISSMGEMELLIKSEVAGVIDSMQDLQSQNSAMQQILENEYDNIIQAESAMQQELQNAVQNEAEEPAELFENDLESEDISLGEGLSLNEEILEEGLGSSDEIDFGDDFEADGISLEESLSQEETAAEEEEAVAEEAAAEEVAAEKEEAAAEKEEVAAEKEEAAAEEHVLEEDTFPLDGMDLNLDLGLDEDILSEEMSDLEEPALDDDLDLEGPSISEALLGNDIDISSISLDNGISLDESILNEELNIGDVDVVPMESEPEPEAKAEPVIPIKPDLSNPNKMMTPEEIAALIADM